MGLETYDQWKTNGVEVSPMWWEDTPIVVSNQKPLDPVDLVIEWLDSQHTTLWSTFNIGPEGDTRKAANWFVNQIASFGEWLQQR